jgi:DNA-binding NtrC family response regulator
MEPFARIALGRGAPAELPNLLVAIGLEPLPERNRRLADLTVDFGADGQSSTPGKPVVRIAMDDEAEDAAATDFASASLYAAASFILSQALLLPAPFLTADQDTFERLRNALTLARGPGRIVVEGETGAGKQALMRAVLAAANDRVARIDCASYDEAGADGEFVSAIRTLATSNEVVSSRAAQGGILFLNRADELSVPAQRRLLNEIHGAPMIRPRIRYLATATRSLAELTIRGRFVAELYNLFEVALPLAPLRERPADIAMLAWYFLRKANPAMVFDGAALKTLSDYPFPGNVRELQNLITRLAIVPLASDGVIGRPDILGQIAAVGTSRWRSAPLMTNRSQPRPVTIASASTAGGAASSHGKSKSSMRPAAAVIRRPPKPPNVPRPS